MNKSSFLIHGGIQATHHRVAAAVVTAVLGLLLVGLTGFSPMPSVHNAAHDARHSYSFPCH